jgi:hypothetical protein
MNDGTFLAAFEAASLEEFHHRDHIRAAWCYLRELPLLEALQRFTASLKHFANAKGQPQLYHETITWAYVFLIHERMEIVEDRQSCLSEQTGSPVPGQAGLPVLHETWDEFADRNTELFTWRPSILDRLYRPETIQSERARRSFILPDAASM